MLSPLFVNIEVFSILTKRKERRSKNGEIFKKAKLEYVCGY